MRNDGFTLTELLIGLAILVAVMAVILPTYRNTMAESEYDKGTLHAESVRLALNTALASNPNLNSGSLGNINCTAAADVGPGGVTASAGNNGWGAAPAGTTCWATPYNARAYRATVYYPDGKVVTKP